MFLQASLCLALLIPNIKGDIHDSRDGVVVLMPQEEFFPLFGLARPAVWKQTELGINYTCAEFDHVPENERQERKRAKKLRKSLAWMSEHNVPSWVVAEFVTYFEEFPHKLPTWLDEAFLWLQENRWQPCLWKYPALGRIRPSDIRITIVALPIWVPYYQKHTAGMMEEDRGGAITMVVAGLSRGTEGSDELNWLRKVGDLCRWEAGNYAAHYVLNLDPRIKEYGDQPLC